MHQPAQLILLVSFLAASCGRSALLEADGGERLPPSLDAGTDGGSCASSADEQELLRRWNVAATGVTVTGYGDFNWVSVADFPHPTYRGGSTEAYSKAATVMTRLLKQAGTRDFLNQHCLVDRVWTFRPGGGSTSLRQFAQLLCTSSLVEAADRTAMCVACRPLGCGN